MSFNIDKITSKFGFTFKRGIPVKKWIPYFIRVLVVFTLNLIYVIVAITPAVVLKVIANLFNAIFYLVARGDFEEAKYRLKEF